MAFTLGNAYQDYFGTGNLSTGNNNIVSTQGGSSGTNWGGGATGVLGGAATGAAIGSVVPVIGTGLGAAAGGILGGLGGLFGGDDEGDTIYEPYPGYLQMGGMTTENVMQHLGKMGMLYSDIGGDFSLSTPSIESQYENLLSGQIGNVSEYGSLIPEFSEAQQNVYDTQKARLGESYDDLRSQAMERYNKLGIATSTPGIQGLEDIDREQLAAEQELAATLASEELQYNLDVEDLANQVMSTLGTQSGLISTAQTGREEYETTNTYEDWLRAYQEDYLWSQLAASMLGDSGITIQQPDSGDSISSSLGTMGAMALQVLPYL